MQSLHVNKRFLCTLRDSLHKVMIFTMGFIVGILVIRSSANKFQQNKICTSLEKSKSSNIHSLPIFFQRNLIITAAVNFGLVSVYRFARSVRASCTFCTLVIIVTKVTMNNSDFKELARVYSITYISNEDYFVTRHIKHRTDTSHFYFTRWIIIKNYLSTLQANGEIFDNIFACDSRDTLFQKNIFEYINSSTQGLYVFMEDIRMTIGTCKTNSGWIKTCFGEAELNRLFNKSISCAGTVLGTWSAFMSYLSAMESQILTASTSCISIPADQGLHNYLVHNNKISNIKIHHISHEYGFVGTVGYALRLKRNQFGLVENMNGSVYAVVHQWDRFKQMVDQFQREYQIIPAQARSVKH